MPRQHLLSRSTCKGIGAGARVGGVKSRVGECRWVGCVIRHDVIKLLSLLGDLEARR